MNSTYPISKPFHLLLLFATWCIGPIAVADEKIAPDVWNVGVAAVDITPEHPIRLNGFASRKMESEGVRQTIWAKALAISQGDEPPALLITLEVLCVPDWLAEEVSKRLEATTPIPRERIAITATHTHSAPMLRGENPTIFGEPIPAPHQRHINEYTTELVNKVVQVAQQAIADRKPARLEWGIGRVGFAINRRTPGGPVDHDFPLLAVKSLDGKLRAVYFNYACHCVTLSDNLISGDWAGYATAAIERDHSGAIAICSVGCGADSNPSTRGVDRADIAADQGEQIATEVKRLFGGFLAPVQGPLRTEFARVSLPLQELPTKEQWEERAKQADAVGYHARVQLEKLARGEKLPESLELPVQSWLFGDSLAMLFLPGETVVDYSLRLKRELDSGRLWTNGYSNSAHGYVPSERILQEGGYEGGGAMIYYDIPAAYAPGLEQKLIDAVHKQVGPTFRAKVDSSRTNGHAPRSPQQATADLRPRPDMQAELVVAEPLVVDPVAIDFAPDGSLWVAEMHDYPAGLDGKFGPGGRVRLVSDSDGDGRYDAATIFLENIPFPTGVTTWRKGVLVCAAPDILYAEDTNGDGVADVKRVLYSGFGTDNYQARVNSLCYGLDGWVYGSCGLFGGKITSKQSELQLGDRDFRIQPDTETIEPATGRTQQGRSRNDWGDWFGCTNSELLIHYPLDDHSLRRNLQLAAPPAVNQLVAADQLFPAAQPLTFALSGQPGLTTAACGLAIYRDNLLGPNYNDNAFVCEPVCQVVHRMQLEPNGATFNARRAPDEQQNEFLASVDPWFRPVQARTGPDGALWVVDMCRYVIEHPRWIPEADAAKLDLRAGEHLGRIYRVYPRDKQPRPIARLDRMQPAELVAALDSPNGPHRDLAGQMLIWNDDRSVAPALKLLVQSATQPEAKLHALTVLRGLHALDDAVVALAMNDASPGVRRQAVRLLDADRLNRSPVLGEELLQLAGDEDALVRLQVAVALGEWHDARAPQALIDLATRHADDPHVLAAVASSATAENVGAMLDYLLRREKDAASLGSLHDQLAATAIATRNAKGIELLTNAIVDVPAAGPSESQLQSAANLLAGLKQDLDRETHRRLQPLTDAARRLAGDSEIDEARHVAAINLLGRQADSAQDDFDTLQKLLTPQTPNVVQIAAVEALGRIDQPAAADVLLDHWKGYSPPLRAAAMDALSRHEAWIVKLFDKIQSNEIATSEIDAAHIERLSHHPSDAIRARSAELFQQSKQVNRQAVVEQFQSVVKLTGVTTRGQALFDKKCAPCHRLDESGRSVGPDLAPLATKTTDYLLLSILDPNRALDNRYLNYVVVTLDGQVVTGVMAAESSASITILQADGKPRVILRSDIDELSSTGKSAMPEGLEEGLSAQDLADIISCVQRAPSK